jgi:hypothetical protein
MPWEAPEAGKRGHVSIVGAGPGDPGARLPEAVAETDLPAPALLVVGEVVGLAERIAWFGTERAQEMATGMLGGDVRR